MSWEEVQLGELLVESRIPADNPDPNRRIRVKLHVEGVEKRPLENEMEGATKQFIRRAGQFIYGKQNFHKGAFGIVPDELDGFETSADIPSFDVREDCLPEWIYYFFKSGNRYLQLEKLARGVGSQRIHPKQIYDIAIPLPPMEKQWELIQDIINTESKFNDFAGEQSLQLDLLKKLRQQILQDAVQGKLVPQDPNDETASVLLQRIKAEKEKLVREKKIKKEKLLPPIRPDEIPFEIPVNWMWCRLGVLSKLITSGSRDWAKYYSDTGALFVRMGNLSKATFNLRLDNLQFVNPPKNSEGNRTKLEENDILISITGEVGNLGLIPSGFGEAYINQHTGLVRLIPMLKSRYLCYCFLSKFLKDQFNAPQRGLKNSFRLSDIDYLIVPLPPLHEQNRIVTKIEHVMTLCDELEQSIQQNQKYTQELLQVALKEELEPKN